MIANQTNSDERRAGPHFVIPAQSPGLAKAGPGTQSSRVCVMQPSLDSRLRGSDETDSASVLAMPAWFRQDTRSVLALYSIP
jgi:hypothetical protein